MKTDYGGLGTSFETRYGRLEIVRRADGVGLYDDWLSKASNMEFEHLTVSVAAAEDIVAAVHPVCAAREVGANALAHADAVLAAATRLVVFPELSLTGYERRARGVNQ